MAGSSAAPEAGVAADVATLLVSTAAIVGNDRAVLAAHSGLGADALGSAIPFLQPGVLPKSVRTSHWDLKQTMTELRTQVVAVTDVEQTEVEELRRVTPGNLVICALTAFGV